MPPRPPLSREQSPRADREFTVPLGTGALGVNGVPEPALRIERAHLKAEEEEQHAHGLLELLPLVPTLGPQALTVGSDVCRESTQARRGGLDVARIPVERKVVDVRVRRSG